ncbi:MAG: hypothetical protein MRY83_22175 [Flavobacteriales bacterium]|nr:hypothetical protein [Flavobacteriales bacterium]
MEVAIKKLSDRYTKKSLENILERSVQIGKPACPEIMLFSLKIGIECLAIAITIRELIENGMDNVKAYNEWLKTHIKRTKKAA